MQPFAIAPSILSADFARLGEDVDKVRNACEKAKAAAPELAIDGELQFDAAVSLSLIHI